jgi:diguanylate cyclase (GGDEF)-like protein
VGQAPVAVLFLDLDGFKAVNDSAGHAVGDELLRECSRRLRSVLRSGDTVARLGGDEFAALLDDSSQSGGALEVGQRVLAALDEPFEIAGRSVVVGASVGIAFGTPESDAEALLRNADLAMYRAKSAGKGRIEVFANEMHEELVRRVEVEADLRRGLALEEFFLAYQPVVDLRTGHVVEVEALLRWQHPERGLVAPGEFIGVAEEAGLIVQLGRFALQESCRQLARWRRAGHDLGIAVNVSARQLQAPGLVDTVAAALRAHGLPPSALTLEITENVLVEHDERTIAKIELLRELGVRLAIDDFGTGYSSLAYLRRFPVDVLKVDRSFVSGVGHGGDLTALTSTIVRLGRELGLTLVAEGIEQSDQLQALLGMGCHRGQGYLFSRPTTPEAIGMLLREAPDLVERELAEAARTSAS